MNNRQFAQELHELWERAQTLHFHGRELLEQIPARQAFRRLVLEIALHDLESFAARAAALANLAESRPPRRKKR